MSPAYGNSPERNQEDRQRDAWVDAGVLHGDRDRDDPGVGRPRVSSAPGGVSSHVDAGHGSDAGCEVRLSLTEDEVEGNADLEKGKCGGPASGEARRGHES